MDETSGRLSLIWAAEVREKVNATSTAVIQQPLLYSSMVNIYNLFWQTYSDSFAVFL